MKFMREGNLFEYGQESVTGFIEESIVMCRDRPEIPVSDLWNSVSELGREASRKWAEEMKSDVPSDPISSVEWRFAPSDPMKREISKVREILAERNGNSIVTREPPAIPRPLFAANTYARDLMLLRRELNRLAERCRTQRADLKEALELLNAERERVAGRLGRRTEEEREGMPDHGEEGGRQ